MTLRVTLLSFGAARNWVKFITKKSFDTRGVNNLGSATSN